ncbi:MAG: type II secretion system protein GspG [Verrucomicrobia bacterium]|nr:MAG: type II secretion system protein GspG [Verrucomicrobiota bacterium]
MLITDPTRHPRAALRRAFTLLEILVVLAIIGLLVGLAVKNVEGIFGGAEESIASTFVNDTLKASLISYRIHVGNYPTTAEGLEALVTAPAGKTGWKGPYIDAKGGRLPVDPWQQPYQYRFPGVKNKTGYDLFSKGKDSIEGNEDDIGNW